MEHGTVFWAAALSRLSFIYKMGEGVKGVVAAIDIPRDWNPRAKQQPTGLIAYAVADAPSPPCSSPTGHPNNRKRPASICSRVFLVGCPVGLEPTVSRSTIWRVNRLRYGHHINAPEGTRTPGPLLRRQLLYPAELRALIAGSCPRGTYCVRYYSNGEPGCQAFCKNFFYKSGGIFPVKYTSYHSIKQ